MDEGLFTNIIGCFNKFGEEKDGLFSTIYFYTKIVYQQQLLNLVLLTLCFAVVEHIREWKLGVCNWSFIDTSYSSLEILFSSTIGN